LDSGDPSGEGGEAFSLNDTTLTPIPENGNKKRQRDGKFFPKKCGENLSNFLDSWLFAKFGQNGASWPSLLRDGFPVATSSNRWFSWNSTFRGKFMEKKLAFAKDGWGEESWRGRQNFPLAPQRFSRSLRFSHFFRKRGGSRNFPGDAPWEERLEFFFSRGAERSGGELREPGNARRNPRRAGSVAFVWVLAVLAILGLFLFPGEVGEERERF
jgi:hypothetical protein